MVIVAYIMGDKMDLQREVELMRLSIGDKWPTPPAMDSYTFLVTEVGEIGDAMLRRGYGFRNDYSRNNSKQPDLAKEIGDTMIMLCTLASRLGIDLEAVTLERITHFKEKHNG